MLLACELNRKPIHLITYLHLCTDNFDIDLKLYKAIIGAFQYHLRKMAIRMLESRLETLTVNDENEPRNGGPAYSKAKV